MVNNSSLNTSRLRRYALPLLAGGIVIAATLLLTLALRQREQHHIRHMTRMVAGGVQADIAADLETRFLGPMRYADLWRIDGKTTQKAWQAKARTFLQEHGGFIAVEWAGRDHTRWSVPESWAGATESATQKDLEAAVHSAGPGEPTGGRSPLFSHLLATANHVALRRVVIPIYSGGELQGIGTAAFPEHDALDSLLADVSGLGYSITVLENGREIYRLPGATDKFAQEWATDTDVRIAGLEWGVHVWPTAALLSEVRTHLPQFVFGMGLALSLLVMLTTHFAQSVKAKNESLTREVEERKRTASALEESERRMNGILDTSPDAVVAVDESQRIQLFNKGAEAIFGYRGAEVLGKPLDLLLPPRFQDSHRAEIKNFGGSEISHAKRMGATREVMGRRKDGAEFPVEASISKLQTRSGVIYTSILRNVTERVQSREALARAHDELEVRVNERTAELAAARDLLEEEAQVRASAQESLRFSEQRLQAILDNCTAVIYMKDVEGRYILINRWYEILFNVKNEEIVGKTDRDLFPEAVAAALRKNDEQVIAANNPIEFEEVVIHPDGSAHTYIAIKFLIYDAKQKPYAVCGISSDITRQKQSETLLSELSGGLMRLQDEERQQLAHDLHEGTAQMLAALGINLGVAQQAASGENRMVRSALDVSKELVERTTRQVKTMAYLLHPPGLDEFGLASALRWYAEGFSSRTGIEVSVQISSNLARFDRDIEVAVFRILQEGLRNIQRHSGSKTAEVVVHQDEYELGLEIADQGRGLPKDIQERFSSGMPLPGMGLTSMRERARQLGGVLHIDSSARGVKVVAKLPTGRVHGGNVVESLKIPF